MTIELSMLRVNWAQDFDELSNVSEDKIEYWMVTIANEIFDVEADVEQWKEDLVKIKRSLFNLLIEQDTTVPPLWDSIKD